MMLWTAKAARSSPQCSKQFVDMGFSVVEVAQWLGHSSAATTLNFYAHADKKSKSEIARSIGCFLKLR